MTTKFWQWITLGIVLLWAAGCRRANPVSMLTATAVPPTHSNTPTLTSSAELTASPTKITATATPFFTPDPALLPVCPTATTTPTPDVPSNPSPSPLPSATFFYCNTVTPSPTPTISPPPTAKPVSFPSERFNRHPLHIQENYLYYYAHFPTPSVAIVDFSDFTDVQCSRVLDIPSDRNISVANHFLFFLESSSLDSSLLYAYDISDPFHPALLTTYHFDFKARYLTVVWPFAFVVSNVSDGLLLIDLSDPRQPDLLGFYQTDDRINFIAVADRYVYLLSGYVLHVVDIADPRQPVKVASLEINGNKAIIVDDYLYIHWQGCNRYNMNCTGYVNIVDVTEPTRPVLVQQYHPAGSLDRLDIVMQKDGYVYMSRERDRYQDDLWILDVSDPANPVEVAHYETPGWSSTIVGDYAFFFDNVDFYVVNVSDPANPILSSSCSLTSED